MAMTLPSLPRARDLRAALPAGPSVVPRERLHPQTLRIFLVRTTTLLAQVGCGPRQRALR